MRRSGGRWTFTTARAPGALRGLLRIAAGAATGAMLSGMLLEIANLPLMAGGLVSRTWSQDATWPPALVLGAPVGALAFGLRLRDISAAVFGGTLYGILEATVSWMWLSEDCHVPGRHVTFRGVVLPDLLHCAVILVFVTSVGALTCLLSGRTWAAVSENGCLTACALNSASGAAADSRY